MVAQSTLTINAMSAPIEGDQYPVECLRTEGGQNGLFQNILVMPKSLSIYIYNRYYGHTIYIYFR